MLRKMFGGIYPKLLMVVISGEKYGSSQTMSYGDFFCIALGFEFFTVSMRHS